MDHTLPQLKPSLVERLRVLAAYYAHRLKETPLLLGWLVIGLVVTRVTDGWMGLAFGLINLVLLGAYVLLIRGLTPDPPAPLPVKRPRLELALGLGVLGLVILIQLLNFDVWTLEPLHRWVADIRRSIYVGAFAAGGLPDWAKQDTYLAVFSTVTHLIPTVLLFLLLGYGRHGMGLARPHWKLTAVLVAITALLGLFTGLLTSQPVQVLLGLYFIGLFINALPEELLFRGLLLPRLETVLANPLNALVIATLLFNAIHIPIDIRNGVSPLMALLGVFGTGYPSGLLWGYLYLRTRSVIPGTLWHGANAILGFILMSQ